MTDSFDLEDYRQCLAINKHALDDEIMEQSDVFYRVSERVALSVSLRDSAKDELARARIKIELKLRKSVASGTGRVTDKEILAKVDGNKKVIALVDIYLQKRTDADLWFALKESFIQRSYMLRNLGSLYVAGYFVERIVQGKDKQSQDTAFALAEKRLTDMRNEDRSKKAAKRKKSKK